MQTKLDPQLAKFTVLLLDLVEEELVSKIELDYAKLAATDVIGKLKLTADVLSNDDLDDKTELQAIWGHFFADPEIVESIRLALTDAASRIQNEDVREGVLLLVNPITATISALADENTADGDQIEKIWIDFIQTRPFILFIEKHLETLLSKIIKNETIVKLISSLLKLFIKER